MNSMAMSYALRFLVGFVCILVVTDLTAEQTDPLEANDVVWESPSIDQSGSMPMGNGDFRLHVPGRTVIEGRLEDGELLSLSVSPPERKRDVVVSGLD